MNGMQFGFRPTLIAASIIAAFASAQAFADDIGELTKPDSSVAAGIGIWSNDRNQLGIYDGQPDNGAYVNLDVNINKRDDATGTWTTIVGRNLGLDNREFRMDITRQGDVGGYFEYSMTPRVNPVRFQTPLLGIGTTSMTINSTSPAPVTLLTLKSEREMLHLGGFKNLSDTLELRFSFKDEAKTGTRLWSRGSSAEFAVEPLDSKIDQLELRLDYTGEALQLSGGYLGSWYRNHIKVVDIITAGAAASSRTYLFQPLDNQAHEVFVNGGYNFTSSTRGTFKLSYSQATQDEHLPAQDIVAIPVLAGSPESLRGRIDTRLVQAGVVSRPIKDLTVNASLRYHDMNDKTPVARYVQTNALCPQGTCVDNTPFSLTTQTGKVDAVYRLAYGYSVAGGVELRQQARDIPVSNTAGTGGTDTQRVVPLRAHQDDLTYRIEGRKAMSDTVNGSIALSYSDRTGTAYSGAGAGPGGAPSNMINPIHLADRGRTKARISTDWTPTDKLSLQVAAEASEDNYNTSASRPYGLLDGSSRLFSVDVNYSISDKWQASVWYSYDQTRATQLNRRDLAPAANMKSELTDTGNAVGLGITGAPLTKVKVGTNVQWTQNVSRYPQEISNLATNGGIPNPGPLGDIENKAVTIKAFSEYALQKNADIRLDLIYERWQTDDWTWTFRDGSPFVYGSTTDGTMALANRKEQSSFAGVKYIYRFQ